MQFQRCTQDDFLQIVSNLEEFWGSDRTRHLHHPMFVHEFGDTALVLRDGEHVRAYLFGFWSQTEPVGYIHLVAVSESHRGKGIGRRLYDEFETRARRRGCARLKALTPPFNTDSIGFHSRLGFRLLGEPNEEGVPIVQNYFGPGQSRVVFERSL